MDVSLLRLYIHPSSNARQVYGAQYALESQTLREYAVEQGIVQGIVRPYGMTLLPGLARAVATRSNRLSTDLHAGRDTFSRRTNLHSIDGRKPMTSEKRRKIESWFNAESVSEQLRENLGPSLELLEASLVAAKARGLEVVLLESPHNATLIGPRYRETQSYYQERLRTFAQRHGIRYLNFNDDCELEDVDFIDFSHLRPSGRTVWQRRLGEEFVRLHEEGKLLTDSARASLPEPAYAKSLVPQG